jgi:trehalose synthase
VVLADPSWLTSSIALRSGIITSNGWESKTNDKARTLTGLPYVGETGNSVAVVALREVKVPVLDPFRLRSLIGEGRHAELEGTAGQIRSRLGGTTVWNVNSTVSGGGVAEMLQVLVGYTLGAGLDVRWLVVNGDGPFFAMTKRLHNRIHGARGDRGALGEAEAAHYRQVMEANAQPLLERVSRGDVALLHDPQTAGLAATLAEAGVHVVWRCHIGSDHRNTWTEQAWQFLRPFIDPADAVVFSRSAYVPPEVPESKVTVIPPSIDPFSPKNQELSADCRHAILRRIGFLAPEGDEPGATFTRRDGTEGEVVHVASMVSEGPPLDPWVPLVVQVSRWDRLKDMQGVMGGFAARIVGRVHADLALVGPSVEGVTDDPEGAEVLAECISAWEALPTEARRRIRLVTLPMEDVDENAVMVNAIQGQATVIVQKSLVEGFGLTVAEGMWKAKPVVASAVGGIIDQIAPGTGVLIDDPADLDAFGDALADLVERPDQILQLGAAAKRHVLANFVGDLHLLRYAALIEKLVAR